MSVPTYFRRDGWVKSATGAAVAGSQIYVCTQPANLTVPPSPLANIYSDPAGVVPITQPIITDGFGHYDYYVLPGTYTEIVALSNVIQQVYVDQTVGIAGNGTSSGTAVLQPYIDIAGFCPGTLTNAQEIARYNISHACSVFSGAVLSVATASAASTGTATITINQIRGGVTTPVGSVSFTVGNKAGSFTWASEVDFIAGDQVQFVSASSDATLAGVAITLVATRTA